jgi:1-acyl-sn-glycerol-3-phosphate acyltransferase
MAKRVLGDDPFGRDPSADAKRPARGQAPPSSDGPPSRSSEEEKPAAPAKREAKVAKAGAARAKKTAPKKRAAPKPSRKAAARSARPEEPAPAAGRAGELPSTEAPPRSIADAAADVAGRVAAAVTDAALHPPPPDLEAPPPLGERTAPLGTNGRGGWTPVPQPAEPPSEYGPSIDRAGAGPSLSRRIADEVRHLEQRMRTGLAGGQPGLTQEPVRQLPLEFVLRHWRALAMRRRSPEVDEFGRDPRVAERFQPLLDFLYRSYFRVEVRGMGNIPDEGRALIVANHSGTLPYDAGMIMHAVQRDHPAHRPVRPLVEDFVFHFPWLGTLMNRIGGVRACQENAERLLEQDQLVAVFPEGIKGIGKLFRQRYQLQRFGRGGFIKLALGTDSPIIPAAVVGAEEVHPMLTKVTWLAKAVGIPYIPVTPTFPLLGPLGLVPLPTKWTIVFGEPLYFNAEYGAEAANDRILVNKLGEQVRHRIQEMIDGLLKERRSIIFG